MAVDLRRGASGRRAGGSGLRGHGGGGGGVRETGGRRSKGGRVSGAPPQGRTPGPISHPTGTGTLRTLSPVSLVLVAESETDDRSPLEVCKRELATIIGDMMGLKFACAN